MNSSGTHLALTPGCGWNGIVVCAVLALSSGVLPVQADQADDAPTRVGVPFRPEPPLRSYVAIRRLESSNVKHRKEAWLVVRTELREDGTFHWQVLDEGGSELIRKRVLHEALEKEADAHADGRASRSGLTADNYTFSTPSPTPGGWRVAIEPRARKEMLVRGSLLVSSEGELLRVEGDLVKRPSFWTRAVHLVRLYGRVDGTHVPLRLDTSAQIRLVGASRLSMTYEYVEINGRSVGDAPRYGMNR